MTYQRITRLGSTDLHTAITSGGKAKRSLPQREQDLIVIADLYVKGYNQAQIATELAKLRDYTITQQSISRDIKTIHDRWLHLYMTDFNAAKVKELAHIDALENEYWEAWRNSQKKQEQVDSEKIEDNNIVYSQGGKKSAPTTGYTRSRVKKKEISSKGEAAFLQGIQWCIEQRCRILGLITAKSTVDINWRKEAEEAGYNPDDVVDGLVNQFLLTDKNEPTKDE